MKNLGLSFKILNASNLETLQPKIAKAKKTGWKLFGDTTAETGDKPGFYQVMAKHKPAKKNETEQVAVGSN